MKTPTLCYIWIHTVIGTNVFRLFNERQLHYQKIEKNTAVVFDSVDDSPFSIRRLFSIKEVFVLSHCPSLI